jgi:hypothetical protein
VPGLDIGVMERIELGPEDVAFEGQCFEHGLLLVWPPCSKH